MIDILLSTYNGELYLREQLDSILAQSCTDWTLLVRDDGSTDGTLKIINDYSARFPDRIKVISDSLGNLGVTKSFGTLLEASKSEYVMFSDQDDYWLKDKISISMDAMHKLEEKYAQMPLLVHTDLSVADSNLNIINKSLREYSNLPVEILESSPCFFPLSNPVTGCTALFNAKVRDMSLPFTEKTEMHDVWVGLVAVKNGKLLYVKQPTILYRQHGHNVCGATLRKNGLVNRIVTSYKRNKIIYHCYHPYVYKSFLHFCYYKIVYFIKRKLN